MGIKKVFSKGFVLLFIVSLLLGQDSTYAAAILPVNVVGTVYTGNCCL